MQAKSDIRIIGFNKYDKPKIKVSTGQKWVTNGRDNSHYDYLIKRYQGSTTHASICNSYVDLTYGKGLAAEDIEQDSDEWLKLLELFNKKDQRKIISDYQIFGQFACQVIRQKGDKKQLGKLAHIPIDKIAPSEEDEFGNITSYWYSKDWTNKWKYPPKEFPAFGTSTEPMEIYVGKPYVVGGEYFSDPDYAPALQYASVEEEISNYYLSHINSGLSFGTVINVPNSYNWSEPDKDKYERKVKENVTGSSNAGRVVINFLDGNEPITIDNIENNTAHKQWDFLGNEARQQLLTGHRCTSPSIVGVISSSGFSNTADEMDTAEIQLMKRVISPKQNFITESISEILNFFDIDYSLYFIPLTEVPEEATEQEKDEAKEIELSKQLQNNRMTEFLEKGEDVNLDEFELIDEIEVDYEEEQKLELASTGVARPNSKSSQDGEDYIVRYKYVGNDNPEREFCREMMTASKVYRKEDILQLTDKAVNPGWGANGADTYSIWFYKGGGNCYHKWNRVIYLKKGVKVDVNSPLAEIISTSEARRRRYKLETNNPLVSTPPIHMPNQGFLNK